MRNSQTTKTMSVRLVGGPLDGATVEVPRGSEVYRVGKFFTYEYAGKLDPRTTAFAKRETTRPRRRVIRLLIQRSGHHPRVGAPTQQPKRGRTDRRGQGARRRAARHE